MSKFEAYLEEGIVTDVFKSAKASLLKIENIPIEILKTKIDLNWKKFFKYLKKNNKDDKFVYMINKLFIKKYSSLNQINTEMLNAYSSPTKVNEEFTVAGLLLLIKVIGPVILFIVEVVLAIMSYGNIPKNLGTLQMLIFAVIGILSLFAETYKEDIVGWLRTVKTRAVRYVVKEA